MDDDGDEATAEQLQSAEEFAEDEPYRFEPIMSQFSPTTVSTFEYIDSLVTGTPVVRRRLWL